MSKVEKDHGPITGIDVFGNCVVSEELSEVTDLFFLLYLQSNKRMLIKKYIRSGHTTLSGFDREMIIMCLDNLGKVSIHDIADITQNVAYDHGYSSTIPNVMVYAESVLNVLINEQNIEDDLIELDLIKFIKELTWLDTIITDYDQTTDIEKNIIKVFSSDANGSYFDKLKLIFNSSEASLIIDKAKKAFEKSPGYADHRSLGSVIERSWTYEATLTDRIRSYYDLMEVFVELFTSLLQLVQTDNPISFNEFVNDSEIFFYYDSPDVRFDYGNNFEVLISFGASNADAILIPKNADMSSLFPYEQALVEDLQYELYLMQEYDVIQKMQKAIEVYERENNLQLLLPLSVLKFIERPDINN